MEEIWKDIKGYEGLYQVSNLGRVRSVEKKIERKKVGITTIPQKILCQHENNMGYYRVTLYDNNHKSKRKFVHRLVAESFVDNPCDFPNINHKDEDKHNNNSDNLEWCDQKYNINYGTRTERAVQKRSTPIVATNKDNGGKIYYKSMSEASRNGFFYNRIKECCEGIRKTHKGFFWNYI